MHKKICFLLIIFQLCFLPAYAKNYTPLNKLARGIVNTGLGWLEIPRQMIKVKAAEEHKLSGEFAGIFVGPLKGLCYFLGRLAVGAYELATFPIPTYKPLIKPEYIFYNEYEEE